jgi:hypothetical protein
MTHLREQAASRYPFNTSAGFDHKAWAKRILWREQHGDTGLLSVQVKFAREAMGMEGTKE